MRCRRQIVIKGKTVFRWKHKFPTMLAAREAARTINERPNQEVPVKAYSCRRCGFYHVGRIKKKYL